MSDLSEARREQILQAACACFGRKGFHQSSMQEICQEAHMSAGSIYRYFRSKEDIIAALCERERRLVGDMFQKAGEESDLMARLDALVNLTMIWMDAPGQAALYLETAAEGARNPQVADLMRATDRSSLVPMVAMIRAAQDHGEVDPAIDAEIAATSLLALSDGFTVRRALDPAMRIEDYAPFVKGFIRRLLQPQGHHDSPAAHSTREPRSGEQDA